ncbi:autophagy-related protein 13 homolog isoform X2 [Orussus abietinus]|uniref:autophagy-related protein 13 homolog isoform X2 n=1 Tax=Orussus abietinus TaxID=222816 RepID=UPI0006269D2C|nr:autophagy-related protein 13 homolog isoform X2 [Orussus abietinus]
MLEIVCPHVKFIEFNLAIQDIPEVLAEAKRALCGDMLNSTIPLCIEISLRTVEGDTMVLEMWSLGILPEQSDPTIRVTYTVYNRMGILLKSLLSVSRITPAYKLSRRQGPESYVICYRIYMGEPQLHTLGDNYKNVRVGQLCTPVGTIHLSVSYRTKMAISPTQTGRDSIMLKSDHFHSDLSPRHARYQQSEDNAKSLSDTIKVGAFAINKQVIVNEEDLVIPDVPFSFLLTPRQTSPPRISAFPTVNTTPVTSTATVTTATPITTIVAATAIVTITTAASAVATTITTTGSTVATNVISSTSTTATSTTSTTISTSMNATSSNTVTTAAATAIVNSTLVMDTATDSNNGNGEKVINDNATPKCSSQNGSRRSSCSLTSANGDFIMVDLKTPFAGTNTNSDLGAFYRECQSAPQLHAFMEEQTLAEQVGDLTKQLETFEINMRRYEDILTSLCESENNN